MSGNVVTINIAWAIPLVVVFWFAFFRILLPKIKSTSKEGEENWKLSAIKNVIRTGRLPLILILLTLLLPINSLEYMGFPSSFRNAVVNFGIGGLIGMGVWIPYYAYPKIWSIEKERVERMCKSIPGPLNAQKYWLPFLIPIGAYGEEIIFRGALIAVPAVLLTFPYNVWVVFILVSSFFAALHVVAAGPNKWDRKLYLVQGISASFALGLIFIWRWSIVAAGTFHLMNNLVPWVTYRLRE